MKLSELKEGMKVLDRWDMHFVGEVIKVGKRTARIKFPEGAFVEGVNTWDEDHIEEFLLEADD